MFGTGCRSTHETGLEHRFSTGILGRFSKSNQPTRNIVLHEGWKRDRIAQWYQQAVLRQLGSRVWQSEKDNNRSQEGRNRRELHQEGSEESNQAGCLTQEESRRQKDDDNSGEEVNDRRLSIKGVRRL